MATRIITARQLDTGSTVIDYDDRQRVVTAAEDGPGVVFVDYVDGGHATFKPGHPLRVLA